MGRVVERGREERRSKNRVLGGMRGEMGKRGEGVSKERREEEVGEWKREKRGGVGDDGRKERRGGEGVGEGAVKGGEKERGEEVEEEGKERMGGREGEV